MKSMVLTLSLLAAAGILFAGNAVSAIATGATLVEQRCTVCHNTDRICKHIGHFSAAQWHATVDKMVKNGARLDPAEQRSVVDYLSRLKAADAPFCK